MGFKEGGNHGTYSPLSLSPCQTRSLPLNFPSWLKIYALLHAWICMHATIQPCISDLSHPMMDKSSNFGSHERCRIPVSMSTSLSMGPTCTYVKSRSLSMGPTCSHIQKGVYISTVEPYCGPRWGPYYHFKFLNHEGLLNIAHIRWFDVISNETQCWIECIIFFLLIFKYF